MSLPSRQRIRVLHVDDEPEFTELTGEFLEREDDRFTVETAASAGDGLEMIDDRPPDCVVSDYNMPGMDGLEFLQAVREDNPDLPFVLYTGRGSEAVASEAISLGVTDYLQKGSDTGQYELLANRISNAVEQYRATRRVETSHQAMDTANEGLSLVRPDGTFSYVNPAFANLFGYEPDELLGERWTVLYHNEEAERLDDDILPAVTEHGYWSGETVRLTKEGDRLVTDHRLSRTAGDVIVCTARDVTPERTASNGRSGELDRLVETMEGHAFYTLDHEGYITDWNEGAERLTGYSAAEILGTHVRQFFTEEDRDRGLPEELIETAKTEGTVTDHGWRVRKDGSRTRTADTVSASYDASGTIRGFGVMMRESTSDPVAAELHRKTDYLEVIVEDSVQPLFIKDASGEYLLANRAYEQLFDIQEENVVGRTDRDLHPEAVAEEVWANDRRVLETDEPIETEEHVVVDGEERTYLSSKVPVHFDDDSDDPDAVFGMATDITERKEREQKLELVETLFEHAQECQFIVEVVDGEFELRHANDYYRRTIGLSPGEPVAGQTPTGLFGKGGGREVIDRYRECVETCEPVTYTIELPVGGSGHVYRTILAPVVSDGDVTHIVGTARDITDDRRREETLRRQNDRLEEFASVVSHDLRNPLRTADGRVELLREECESEHIDDIARALDRMDTLIEDLLTLAREGDQVGEVERVALADLIDDCWQNTAAPRAEVVTDCDRAVYADRSRLQQLMENLLRNAVEHGGRGVTVTVGELETGFYVEDDGPGIPEANRDDVFEAGYSTSAEGTGFGLRIVRQVADAHGWVVAVSEGDEGGARFEVTGVEFADR